VAATLSVMAKRTTKVELYEQIRRAHDRDELSIRELARTFHVHRRTVREALICAIPPPRKAVERAAPAIGPWKATIRAWLEADKSVPKKQRHTARRIWQRLVDEHAAEVSETTVRRYVAKAKGRKPILAAEVMVPQTHPLGYEAEVDFGRVSILLAGVMTELWMFVMRLSASGRAFHRVYANQAQEAFLDGHVRAFAHLGVPARVRYDNLKPAVIKVLMGRNRTATASRRCAATTCSSRSIASRGSRALTRRAASKERSGASAGVTSCRCRRCPSSPS